MAVYLSNISFGFFTFVIIAMLITLPYLVHEYRKYGSVPFIRSFLFFSFVLYCICAFYMTILPLPDPAKSYAYAASPQLDPMRIVNDYLVTTPFVATKPSTWLATLLDPIVYESIFNMLLLLPLGMYLRYYYERRWWQALLIGFCTSLFFELTQLTGIFGIYAHPYRLFDVDDLIINTFGCMVGFWVAGPMRKLFPDLDDVDKRAYARSDYASATRRLLSVLVDWMPVVVVQAVTSLVAYQTLLGYLAAGDMESISASISIDTLAADFFPMVLATFLSIVVFFMVIPCITHGQTLGEKMLKLRVVQSDGDRARWFQIVWRWFMLYFIILPLPVIAAWYAEYTSDAQVSMIVTYILDIALPALSVLLIVRLIRSAQGHPLLLAHDLLSGTRVASSFAEGRGEHDKYVPEKAAPTPAGSRS